MKKHEFLYMIVTSTKRNQEHGKNFRILGNNLRVIEEQFLCHDLRDYGHFNVKFSEASSFVVVV